MQELKVVFSDIDGTLLRDDKSLSDKHREAIHSLKKNGIHFVIATGRGPMAVETVFNQIGFKTDMICYSGEYIIRDDKRVFNSGFSYEEAKEIAEFLDTLDLDYGIYSGDNWLAPRYSEKMAEEEALVNAKSTKAELDILDNDAIINKFLGISDPEHIDDVIAKLRKRFPTYDILKSLDYLAEINKGGHNKGTACIKYCEMFDINPENAICFGDCYNDLEMLRLMPNVCIMANAPEDIKAEFSGNKSKRIIDSNMQDGIYNELYRRGYIS